MAHIYCFTRNRCTSIEHVDEKTVKASCRLQDTLTDALVEVTLNVPELEILDVNAEVRRTRDRISTAILDSLQKAKGVRVGPGMVKILKGLIGEREDTEELIFMTEECCQAVILSFTKGELDRAPKEPERGKEHYIKLLKETPRLYDSCIAFAPGSPLVEGFRSNDE